MRARTGLREPWVGNDPGPPGPKQDPHSASSLNSRYFVRQLIDNGFYID